MKLSGYHIPVLLNECIEHLNIRSFGDYADCTLGGGGHSKVIVKKLCRGQRLHCFDRDRESIEYAEKVLDEYRDFIVYYNEPFSSLGARLSEKSLNGILYDLGVSSHQIDSARGFSFAANEPLDMRMDRHSSVNAQTYLRKVSEEDFANALKENSDLDKAGRLAKRILSELSSEKEITAQYINDAVCEVYFNRKEELNSIKARVFQAIRMEVNGEIQEIKESLKSAVDCLISGGRLCVITYHSKEAKAVKEVLHFFEQNCLCPKNLPVCKCGGNNKKIRKISKKPIVPSAEEIRENPRSRSACLRVYERI